MATSPRQVNLVDRMRMGGIRVTGPRRAIARVLEESEEHLDVEQITERAKKLDPSVHRATVYRTLGLFKALGLVDELDLLHLRGDRHYYEVRTGGDHGHVICTTCNKVTEPEGEALERMRKALGDQTGYRINFVRLEVGGTCPSCQQKEEQSR
jgi:Fur family ferric uptake transcriptional regulator